MRSKIVTSLAAAVVLGWTVNLAAQPTTECGVRSTVKVGVGLPAYNPAVDRDRARPITFDEIANLKYPRTIRSTKDLPSAIAPKSRIGSWETTLWAIDGFVECGGTGGRAGGFTLQLQEATNIGSREIDFSAPRIGCTYGTTNFERFKEQDRLMEPWLGSSGSGGCGYINHFVRIIGYGFWEETNTSTPTQSSVRPSIYPVLDVIIFDQNGQEITQNGDGFFGAPDPAEARTIDLNFSTTFKNAANKIESHTFHPTDKDGVWFTDPGFAFETPGQAPTLSMFNLENNSQSRTSGPGWGLFFVPTRPLDADGFPITVPIEVGPYIVGASTNRTTSAQFTIRSTDLTTDCHFSQGRVTVNDIQWDCLATPAFHHLHLVSLDASFSGTCDNSGNVTGRIRYTAPPQVACNSTGGGGGGTGGGGGGTGGGGGGTGGGDGGGGTGDGGGGTSPTPTPTPASTPQIVVPTSVQFSGVQLNNLETKNVVLTTAIPDGFNADVALSASSEPEGLILSFSPQVILAPGGGTSVLHITADAKTRPNDYRILLTINGGGLASQNSIKVRVGCDPPFILGIDQPRNTTISSGTGARLEVKPTGSQPIAFQWYAGQSGNTSNPVANATTSVFNTGALTSSTDYWVRVTNPCGSVDSNTVTVTVQ